MLILDNSFRDNKDAHELSKEIFTQFKDVFEKKPQALNRSDAVDLLVRSFDRTNFTGADSNSQQLIQMVAESHLMNPETFKNLSQTNVLDLMIFFQRPQRRLG